MIHYPFIVDGKLCFISVEKDLVGRLGEQKHIVEDGYRYWRERGHREVRRPWVAKGEWTEWKMVTPSALERA